MLEGLLGCWPEEDRVVLIARGPIRTCSDWPASWQVDVHHGPGRLPGSLWEQLSLPGRVRRARADVLLSPAYGMPWRAPCPVAVGMHDCAFAALPETFRPRERLRRRWNARIASRRAAFLFMGSRFAADEARRWLDTPDERLLVLPYGVDARFQPPGQSELSRVRRRYDLPPRPLLYVGSHLRRRGLPGLVGALVDVAARHDDVELCRMGSRPPDDVDDGGRWLGFVDEADLPALYGAATAVLYPSRYEGFGLPVLEALACGTPVLTSAVASLRELFENRARLLPADDVASWRAAIEDLLEDGAEVSELEPGAARWARSRDWSKAAAALRARIAEAVS